MRNFKTHKSTKLSCIASGDIKMQKRESNEEGEERRSCSVTLLWRLNKFQIRKCLRRKNESFGAQIRTHKLGIVWLTHSSLSSSFFFFLFSVLYRSEISFPAKMVEMSWNGRNRPVQPCIWGSTNHSYFCTSLGFGAENSGHTSQYDTKFTPLVARNTKLCIFVWFSYAWYK